MKWIKNNLANLLTTGNLICGVMAIIVVFERGNSILPFVLMLLAAILDFLDGFVARATKTNSLIGADLDSLADMVTFGVLPGLMAYKLLPGGVNYFAICIPVFSAWRLAKFNNDKRSSSFFYGLPTPANALFYGGAYAGFISQSGVLEGLNMLSTQMIWTVPLIVFLSVLMVSEVRLLSNKTAKFSFVKHKWHVLVLVQTVLSVAFMGYFGICLAIINYIVLSIISTFANSKKTQK